MSADTVVDLPPPPEEESGHDCQGHSGHCCHKEQKSSGKFFAGCMTGCLISILMPLAFALTISLIGACTMKSVLEQGMEAGDFKFPRMAEENSGYGVDEYPFFREVWSCGEDDEGSAKIVRIPVEGTIMLGEPRWSKTPGSASTALQAIKRATLDEDVSGIILEVDSPGGGITASDIIWKALKDFKAADTNRAVVVMMGDLCASGGYYISMGADYIVAHPTTLTGSIGVIISSYNIKELAEKIGIKDVSIASGENKQMLSPFRDLTDEQHKMLKDSVDALHRRFVSVVVEGRGLPQAKIMEIADGRVFLATEAEKLGLIDKIGYFDDALDAMANLVGNPSLYVVRYEHKMTFMDMLEDEGLFGMISGIKRLEEVSRTRLMYKW